MTRAADPPDASVLVVEDDPAIALALMSSLRAAGYAAATARTAREALEMAADRRPDVLVLDLLLPDGHGVDVCLRIREWTRTPIIVVSAVDAEDEKVRALDAGADDYVTKPFSVGELLARLRAALRRGVPEHIDQPLTFGAVEVDLSRRTVRSDGSLVDVTRQEYEVLAVLSRQPGRVLTHRTLIASAWSDGEGSIASLRFHVAALTAQARGRSGRATASRDGGGRGVPAARRALVTRAAGPAPGDSGHAERHVLVVDDEPQIVRALGVVLRAGGFRVMSAASAGEAIRSVALSPPAAVLLDLRLPDGSGVDVCRTLRQWSTAPLIVVSASDDEDQKIEALDAGADDYVTKPFSASELLARVRAAIRRSAVSPGDAPVIRFGEAVIDLERRLVRRCGDPIHLTVREYELLACLARHPGRVLTHAALLQSVWGPSYDTETHYLRVYMANLRRKLEPDPATPRFLLTVSGVGYRLQSD